MSKQFMQHLALIVFLICSLLNQIVFAEEAIPFSTITFAKYNYQQLNKALSQYQSAASTQWPLIPDYPALLKLRTRSHSVQILRERLEISGDLTAENNKGGSTFDYELGEAVKKFQIRHGLKPDGTVGRMTRNALNISAEERLKQLELNIQRWGELSDKVSSRFIMVNIPDYHLYLVDNDQIIMTMKAIVGKPDLPTPEIASKVTRIVFNPAWNIPKKIARRDIIPKILEDPSYLDRMHIRVYRNETEDSPRINPYYINWWNAQNNEFSYNFRQDPGNDNALGLIKFEFQNTYDVYMHDTPAKDLFSKDVRSFSHGCIRLEKPFELAAYLMKDDPEWSEEKTQDILNIGRTKYVRIPKPIPIFITYLTAWVDDEGRINFRDDVYQQDQENEPGLETTVDEERADY